MMNLRNYIFYYGVGTILLLSAVFFARAELATFWWEVTRLYPEEVLSINPDAALALEMGKYYFDVGPDQRAYDIDRAEYFYAQALELDPNAPLAWYQLARISFLRSDQASALYRINKQIARTGDEYMYAYYVRGLIRGFWGDADEAIADFEKYLRWDTDGWYTYNDLAWLFFKEGRFQEAADIAARGLEKTPDSPWLLMSAGIAEFNLGNVTYAQELLSRAEVEARRITINDWRTAYPGNDPQVAAQGLAEFRGAIETNLALVNSAASTSAE